MGAKWDATKKFAKKSLNVATKPIRAVGCGIDRMKPLAFIPLMATLGTGAVYGAIHTDVGYNVAERVFTDRGAVTQKAEMPQYTQLHFEECKDTDYAWNVFKWPGNAISDFSCWADHEFTSDNIVTTSHLKRARDIAGANPNNAQLATILERMELSYTDADTFATKQGAYTLTDPTLKEKMLGAKDSTTIDLADKVGAKLSGAYDSTTNFLGDVGGTVMDFGRAAAKTIAKPFSNGYDLLFTGPAPHERGIIVDGVFYSANASANSQMYNGQNLDALMKEAFGSSAGPRPVIVVDGVEINYGPATNTRTVASAMPATSTTTLDTLFTGDFERKLMGELLEGDYTSARSLVDAELDKIPASEWSAAKDALAGVNYVGPSENSITLPLSNSPEDRFVGHMISDMTSRVYDGPSVTTAEGNALYSLVAPREEVQDELAMLGALADVGSAVGVDFQTFGDINRVVGASGPIEFGGIDYAPVDGTIDTVYMTARPDLKLSF